MMDDVAAERPRRRRPATDMRDEPLQRRRPAPDLRDERTRRRPPAPEWQDEPPRRRPRPPQSSPRNGEPMPRGNREPRPHGYRPIDESESLPRRRPASRDNGTGARHPVSQVRYRKAAGDESGPQPRTRPRQPRGEADSWEFDI